MKEVVALGDRAWRFAIAEGSDRKGLLALLRATPGVTDVVIAEGKGAVWFADGDRERVKVAIERAVEREGSPSASATLHTVRVVYDGDDLGDVARVVGATVAQIVAWHAAATYDVAMLGFMPGFAYLRGLDERLVLPRLVTPRTRVPARSVAIAAGYTGIYPSPSPGGWHLLGEALDFVPFDAHGAAFAIGDQVRFEPVARPIAATSQVARVLASAPGRRGLEVTAVRAPALLVDRGRPGHMHEGVPRGGPLVRSAFTSANASVGNGPEACAIELYGALDVVARGGRVTIADAQGPRVLAEGEAITVAPVPSARVGYLAVHGGIDVPAFLGSRTTLLSAQRGGLNGRPLVRGAFLVAGDATSTSSSNHGATTLLAGDAPLAIVPGPDLDPALLAALLAASFAIAPASDRTGTRLLGPPLPGSMHHAPDRRSAPMARGAIELTPSGPIVLGPDHPTTGGYPVIAVLREHAQDAFFARPLGATVRFVGQGRG